MVITCHTMGLILLDRGDRSVERCLGISHKHSHWLGTVAGCLTRYISFSIHSSSSLGVRTGSQVPDKEADSIGSSPNVLEKSGSKLQFIPI